MSTATPPTVGSIITSTRARKIIYGVYAIAAIIVGGIAAYWLGIGQEVPTWVVGAQAVIAYLGIPVGGLALANTASAPVQPLTPSTSR